VGRRDRGRAAFGARATPLDEALATTIGWYGATRAAASDNRTVNLSEGPSR